MPVVPIDPPPPEPYVAPPAPSTALRGLMNRAMVIITRTDSMVADEFGNVLPVETLTEIFGELQQQRRAEPSGEGEMADTHWLLIVPAGTALSTSSAVVCDGQTYELVGDPWQARNPRTQLASHIEATLRRTASASDEETSS